MKTETHDLTLDGVTFCGRLPYTISDKRPDLGPLFHADTIRAFDAKIVRQIRARGLGGPQSFEFCRKFCALSTQKTADLLGVDLRTIQRWEEKDVPRAAMLLVARMADECARGKMDTRESLERMGGARSERPLAVDVDAG